MNKSFIKDVSFSVISAAIIDFILMIIISLITMFADVGSSLITIFIAVAKIISIALGIFISFKDCNFGYLKGMISAIFFESICFIIAFSLNKAIVFDVSLIIEVLFLTVFGFLFGALKVNIIK